jgi:hypothetical protein
LPFDNLSSNDENQYFADGIVEDLLTRLSQIEGLKVISRTSSEMFRDKGSKTIPEIAGKITSELSLVLTEHQLNALKHDRTRNLKAFELYQMGRL